jgi:hypothetical protein
MPCSPVKFNRRLTGTYRIRRQGQSSACFMLVSYWGYSSTLKMELIGSSTTSVDFHRTTTLHKKIITAVRTSNQTTVYQLVTIFPALQRIQKFITMSTRVHLCPLSWAGSIQSTSLHPISLKYILTWSVHLLQSLPSGILLPGFPTKILLFLYHPLVNTVTNLRVS